MRWLTVVLVLIASGCVGDDPTPGPSGSSGASGTSGTSGTPSGAKRAFVTSAKVRGDFGGRAKADALCAAAAQGAKVPLAGVFIAWLSDEASDAKDPIPADTEWRLVGSETVVGTRTELTTGKLLAPILADENGVTVAGHVWTGTNAQGLKLGTRTCAGWVMTSGMGAFGDNGIAGGGFTESGDDPCTAQNHLYCLQR